MYDAFGSLIADNIAYFQSQTEFLYKDHEIKKSGDADAFLGTELRDRAVYVRLPAEG
jgi:hypothetical protein